MFVCTSERMSDIKTLRHYFENFYVILKLATDTVQRTHCIFICFFFLYIYNLVISSIFIINLKLHDV